MGVLQTPTTVHTAQNNLHKHLCKRCLYTTHMLFVECHTNKRTSTVSKLLSVNDGTAPGTLKKEGCLLYTADTAHPASSQVASAAAAAASILPTAAAAPCPVLSVCTHKTHSSCSNMMSQAQRQETSTCSCTIRPVSWVVTLPPLCFASARCVCLSVLREGCEPAREDPDPNCQGCTNCCDGQDH